jgi:hypothetical protein
VTFRDKTIISNQFGSIYCTSLLTNEVFTKKKGFRQTAFQACVNEDAICQNILDQLQGNDNAANVTGFQP